MIRKGTWLLLLLVPLLLGGRWVLPRIPTWPQAESAPTVDGFGYPFEEIEPRPPWFALFGGQNPLIQGHSRCFDQPISALYHAGEDWFRPAGTPVLALARGEVVGLIPDWDHGDALIVKHTLPEGQLNPWGEPTIHSVYLHLESAVRAGELVERGQVLGQLTDWGPNSHLHLELRRHADMRSVLHCPASGGRYEVGPSYTDEAPGHYGYLHPQEWIEQH